MDIRLFPTNSKMQIWIVSSFDRVYCGRTAALKATFEKGKVRIIIYERLTKYPARESDLLNHCVDGIHLLITHVEVGRRDLYENNDPYLTLLDCSVIRSWIPKPVAMDPGSVQHLNFFVELESKSYAWEEGVD